MIELLIKHHLESLTDLPIYVEDEPENAPAKYLLVKRTGDSENEHVQTATFAIESYGSSTFEASELNETVKSWMKDLINNKDISKVKYLTSYKDNDVAKKRYRYRATFDITTF